MHNEWRSRLVEEATAIRVVRQNGGRHHRDDRLPLHPPSWDSLIRRDRRHCHAVSIIVT